MRNVYNIRSGPNSMARIGKTNTNRNIKTIGINRNNCLKNGITSY